MKALKGGTEGQRKYAMVIRAQALKLHPWGLSLDAADKITVRLKAMTSPLFFIKYKDPLESGNVVHCLSLYDEDNYQRRAKFAQAKSS